MKNIKEQGFSAVELLITLFIAAVFLFAGYQLYIQVTKDAADADRTARVSNAVQEKMRKRLAEVSAQYPSGCVAASETNTTTSQSLEGVGDVSFNIVTRCPIPSGGSATNLFQTTVTATYTENGHTRTLQHSTYAN